MAKDPAFLFYPGDWLGGTMGMSFEEKGAYLELLLFQFNNGKFSKAQAKQVLSICSASVFEKVIQKFNTDGNFLWKQKLSDEIDRRRKFTESRKNNAKSKKEPKAYAKHMETGTETINETENNNKKEYDFSKPDIDGDEIVFPIDTPAVRDLWVGWKRYRWAAHSARYGMMGEQADLKRLERMDFKQIESTVLTAIASNWKNLYPEKNGTRTNNIGKGNGIKADQSRATSDYLSEYYSNKAKQQ